MLNMIKKEEVWIYLSLTQQDLMSEGKFLIDFVKEQHFKDYSFLVFPYAKAYEGFLKQLFLDLEFISHHDYISDHIRIGKLMSPHLIRRLGEESVYAKIRDAAGEDLAHEIWEVWKVGRNEVFHYYPHNIKSLSHQQAIGVAEKILHTMVSGYQKLKMEIES